jgi:predicted DNA-binding protein with PD1-like motif
MFRLAKPRIFNVQLSQGETVFAEIAESASDHDIFNRRSSAMAMGFDMVELQPKALETGMLL